MRLQNGPKSVFYACPEYDKKYHGEKGCPNRVSTEIVEQILDILGEKIEEAEQKGEEINLKPFPVFPENLPEEQTGFPALKKAAYTAAFSFLFSFRIRLRPFMSETLYFLKH